MADQPLSETTAFHNPQTRRLRLQPLPTNTLPPHSLLSNTTSTTNLTDFLTEILNETISFTDTLMHTEFRAKNKPTTSSPSTAPVQLLTFDLMQESNGKGETWFGRRSIHEDAAKDGSASWAEFENGLFHDHSVNEGKYTPDVFDTRHVLSYTEAEGLDTRAMEANGWSEVNAHVYEMGHEIPGPLNHRVFSVLVVRGKVSASRRPVDGLKDTNGFATAQIPIDLSNCQAAFYANGRHKTEGENEAKKAKVVMGEYVSVERCRQQADGKVAWEMATASDAKGYLPMGLQKMGVPGAVVKDVGLFVKWVQSERKSGAGGIGQ